MSRWLSSSQFSKLPSPHRLVRVRPELSHRYWRCAESMSRIQNPFCFQCEIRKLDMSWGLLVTFGSICNGLNVISLKSCHLKLGDQVTYKLCNEEQHWCKICCICLNPGRCHSAKHNRKKSPVHGTDGETVWKHRGAYVGGFCVEMEILTLRKP